MSLFVVLKNNDNKIFYPCSVWYNGTNPAVIQYFYQFHTLYSYKGTKMNV